MVFHVPLPLPGDECEKLLERSVAAAVPQQPSVWLRPMKQGPGRALAFLGGGGTAQVVGPTEQWEEGEGLCHTPCDRDLVQGHP